MSEPDYDDEDYFDYHEPDGYNDYYQVHWYNGRLVNDSEDPNWEPDPNQPGQWRPKGNSSE